MTYAATPAGQPLAEASTPAEEAKAPPTIDSHSGKLSPITCFGCGPDGATSLLMMLALLSTLAPRGLKLAGRALDLSATRLAPGLLFTAALVWNLLPSRGSDYDFPARFQLANTVSTLMAIGLAGVAFLSLASDALMPIKQHARGRAIAAMTAAGLAIVALLLAAVVDVDSLMADTGLSFDGYRVAIASLGLPVGAGLLLLWRRFDGWVFNLLLVLGTLALTFVGGSLALHSGAVVLVVMTVTLTTTAALGAGLRAMGLPGWQGLTGRAAWVMGWILRILSVMTIGSWVVI